MPINAIPEETLTIRPSPLVRSFGKAARVRKTGAIDLHHGADVGRGRIFEARDVNKTRRGPGSGLFVIVYSETDFRCRTRLSVDRSVAAV